MDSMHKKDDIENTMTGNKNKGRLIDDAVDTISLFEEDIEEPPPVLVAPPPAALLVPNPPDEELQEQTNNGKRYFSCRPLYLSMLAILVVSVVTAGVLVTLFVVRRPSSSKALHVGGAHTCTITNNNKLKCWGFNHFGQLGDGTMTNCTLPTTIDLGLNVYAEQVALGGAHTCAITNDNKLKCWGWNEYGQLGDGTMTNRALPTTIDLGLDVYAKQIALGFWHTCAITNGNKLKCWGGNEYGQIGDGTTTEHYLPTTIDLGKNVHAQQIELGFWHTCAITNGNKLKCWGRNYFGQLGDGTTTSRALPTTIDLGLNVHAQEIALGAAHTCAITNDNKLKCWGGNEYGQLGDGTTTDHYLPTTINVGFKAYVEKIALGSFHTCAVTNDNKLKCWGRNNVGQLGDATKTQRTTPTSVQ